MRTLPVPPSLDSSVLLKKSKIDVDYYVRTTGVDTNDGLTIGTATREIQAIINRLPYKIKNNILIDIGPGIFESFKLDSFIIDNDGSLLIQGTMGLSILATGLNSGTLGTSTDYVGVDLSGGWTVGDLEDRFVKVDGAYYIIKHNTTTSFEIVTRKYGGFTGKTYTIEDPLTIISESQYKNMILFSNIKSGFESVVSSLRVNQMRLENTEYACGIGIEKCDSIFCDILQIVDPYPWGVQCFRNNFVYLTNIAVINPFWGGYNILSMNELRPYGIISRDGGSGNTFAGVEMSHVNSVNGVAVYINNNGNGPGISFRDCNHINAANNNIECNNCNTHGIFLENSFMTNTNHNDYKGSGNGGAGMYIGHRAIGVVKTGVNITGITGDLVLGDTVKSWSDLVADGDIITHPAFNCAIRRNDS